jgi:hypothetical protein
MNNDNYVKQLERLIAKELLPVYERYNREHGIASVELPQTLLESIGRKQQIPALLKPKEILP